MNIRAEEYHSFWDLRLPPSLSRLWNHLFWSPPSPQLGSLREVAEFGRGLAPRHCSSALRPEIPKLSFFRPVFLLLIDALDVLNAYRP